MFIEPTLGEHQRNLNILRIQLSHNQFSSERDWSLTSQLHSASFIISMCLSFNCFVSCTHFIRNLFWREDLRYVSTSQKVGGIAYKSFHLFHYRVQNFKHKTPANIILQFWGSRRTVNINVFVGPAPDPLKQCLCDRQSCRHVVLRSFSDGAASVWSARAQPSLLRQRLFLPSSCPDQKLCRHTCLHSYSHAPYLICQQILSALSAFEIQPGKKNVNMFLYLGFITLVDTLIRFFFFFSYIAATVILLKFAESFHSFAQKSPVAPSFTQSKRQSPYHGLQGHCWPRTCRPSAFSCDTDIYAANSTASAKPSSICRLLNDHVMPTLTALFQLVPILRPTSPNCSSDLRFHFPPKHMSPLIHNLFIVFCLLFTFPS